MDILLYARPFYSTNIGVYDNEMAKLTEKSELIYSNQLNSMWKDYLSISN